MKTLRLCYWMAFLVLVGTGCATRESTRARPLASSMPPVDLSGYRVATVVPFASAPGRTIDPAVGERLAGQIAERLRGDFGPLFEQVRRDEPQGVSGELLVTGVIQTYRPGSKAKRFFFPGFGSSSLEGELVLQDAQDRRVLLRAPFDRLWAWGGWLGTTRDIEDMVEQTAASAAATIAQAKGWKSR